ncbi:MAG: hypothetical protein JNL10_16890 [Verrucomicrobiales bacterium]|nr:hypothetical protein [Verrucomicrobiales bacterium]
MPAAPNPPVAPPNIPSGADLRERRESSRDSLLRANTAVTAVIAIVLALSAAALWQSRRATRLQGEALLQQHRALTAENRARADLWRALLAEATAHRLGQSLDRRDRALDSLRRAAAIAPSRELRDEAIAVLALPESRLEETLALDPGIRSYEMDWQLRHCALGQTNGDVVIRRLQDDTEVRRLRPADGPVPTGQGAPLLMDFSRDGALLSVRYEHGAFAVWETGTGRLRFLRDADRVRRPASRALFSSDGRYVVAPVFVPDGFAVLDAETGRPVAHFPEVTSFHHAAVRPGAHQFAAYTEGRILILDWDLGKAVGEFAFPAGARRLAWSPDGRLLAAGGDTLSVRVWNVPAGTFQDLPGHPEIIYDVQFDPDGQKLATIAADASTRIWDLREGRLIGQTGDRRLIRWGTEGRTGWSVRRKHLEVRREIPNPLFTRITGVPGEADGLTLDLSADGRWAISRTDAGGLLAWDLARQRVGPIPGLSAVSSACFDPRALRLYLVGARGLESVDLTVADYDGTPRLEAGSPVRIPGSPDHELDLVTISAGGTAVATVRRLAGAIWVQQRPGDTVPMQDVLHSSVLRESGSARGTGTIGLSPDGAWLAVGADGNLGTHLFDARTGKPVRRIDDESGGVQFSPDGRRFLLVSPHYCRLYDTGTWTPVWTHPGDSQSSGASRSAALSPDGSQVAALSSSRSVDLLTGDTGLSLGRLEAPAASPINRIRWSEDGQHLVLSTRENTLDLWNPGLLRRELESLKLDGNLPAATALAPVTLDPPEPPGFPGWIAPVTLATAGLVSGIAFRSLRRHRRLIEEYARAESLATHRERELQMERELSELKGRFVSMVSHEFRTPLGITMSAVELLGNYADRLTPERRSELLEDIRGSTLRMAGLMEQVLLLGRVESGRLDFRPSPLDLPDLLTRLADETASATHHRCPIQVRAEPAMLAGAQGDESLLRHILSNLLSNAVKYSPPGATVELTAGRDGVDAVVQVRDRGIGIPEADRARLFEAFHRASNVGQTPGTGLGLLIVKRCAGLHRGTLTFESVEGAGTVFTVRVPMFGLPAAE